MPAIRTFAAGVAALVVATIGAACIIHTAPSSETQPAIASSAAPAPTPSATPVASAAPAASASPTTSASAAPATSASANYDACAGKKCGDRCTICPLKSTTCLETALVKMCHPDGQCKPATTVDCSKPAGK